MFLLSSKAGGVGLNLIGASRVVLSDIDWNPANNLQVCVCVCARARACVCVYRLLIIVSQWVMLLGESVVCVIICSCLLAI